MEVAYANRSTVDVERKQFNFFNQIFEITSVKIFELVGYRYEKIKFFCHRL